jgi:hypothetical protein
MEKISPLQRLSGCLIAINMFAINLFILIISLIERNKEEDFLINFSPLLRQSQLSKILDEGTVKVAIQDDKAYWVIDNILYRCNISKDGKINNENAEKVDVFDMSEKEVNNLMSIIDNINS